MDLQSHVPHVSVHRENKEGDCQATQALCKQKICSRKPWKGPTQFLSIVLLLHQQSLCSVILILTLSQHYILMEIPFLLSPALIFLPLVVLVPFIFLFTVVFPTGTSDVNQWVGLRQGHFVFSWTWEHFSSSKKVGLLIWYIAETLVSF